MHASAAPSQNKIRPQRAPPPRGPHRPPAPPPPPSKSKSPDSAERPASETRKPNLPFAAGPAPQPRISSARRRCLAIAREELRQGHAPRSRRRSQFHFRIQRKQRRHAVRRRRSVAQISRHRAAILNLHRSNFPRRSLERVETSAATERESFRSRSSARRYGHARASTEMPRISRSAVMSTTVPAATARPAPDRNRFRRPESARPETPAERPPRPVFSA